jgi:Lrp/AsnC family leucine-responsive transcriptional regulator
MDEIDRNLIEELQRDARLTRSELGRRVGLSPTATGDRLRRLEETGVIQGYHASINSRAAGYGVSAILRIRPVMGQLKKVESAAQRTPEVIECHRVTGDDCYIMKILVPEIDQLEGIIDRFTPFGSTTTSIIHSTPVPPRAIPPRI